MRFLTVSSAKIAIEGANLATKLDDTRNVEEREHDKSRWWILSQKSRWSRSSKVSLVQLFLLDVAGLVSLMVESHSLMNF